MRSIADPLTVLALVIAACNTPDMVRDDEPPPDPPTDADATHEYRVHEVVTGLAHPWGLAFLPGGDILITERPGRVRLVRGGVLSPEPIAGAPEVRAAGQGGLLDIALHPDFASNRILYLSFSKPVAGGATTAVARARWQDDRLDDLQDIFVAEAVAPGGQHFGSRLLFDRAGMLYITIGDRGSMQRAQDLGNHAGTTIRLHDNGRVPDDNPFVGQAGTRPEIFTYGNRNAQGMALHPETGEIWQNEHGPQGGDEVNIMRAGANYGWPEYRYANHYDGRPIPDYEPGAGIEIPLVDWTPAVAPSGMTFYTGDRFPNWRGHVFNGSLVGRHIRRVVFDGREPVHQERLLGDYGERIRAVKEGPDGYIYFLTDSPNGVLARLEPAGG